MYNVVFSPKGKKDLVKLPKDLQKRVINKITFFASVADPLSFAKPLVNLPPLTHRFRVGDYRIAFFIKGETLCIDRIEHRKDVYAN
ncbi:MAG: type II toxin-antitoxin system RelE/ParE family toxin [Patescibacteria group bacterium]